MFNQTFTNWHPEQDAQGIVWLKFDRANKDINTLNQASMDELSIILDTLSQGALPTGLVISSAKKRGFIAGADIVEFKDFDTAEKAYQAIRTNQGIFDKLSQLKCPTVAMIEGFCLGGGMELALACDYRVALEAPTTKLGLPEVMLGIQPGWGGSVRLPRLVGVLTAMDLMLSGRLIAARAAKKIGMVTAAVPKRQLTLAVQQIIAKRPAAKPLPWWHTVLDSQLVRPFVGKLLHWQVSKKASPKHYPAPFAMIDAWVQNPVADHSQALLSEAKSITRLFETNTAKQLVRVFFLRERMKGLAKSSTQPPTRVHVIGAGVMGGDIALWCALRGFEVTLQDSKLAAIGATCKRGTALFKKKLKLPHLVAAARDRLLPDPAGLGIVAADVIIEAIIEDVAAKQQLFAKLEQQALPGAILATNTSTIPLDQIAQGMQHKQRLVGIHFFNPVAKMPLVEVVSDKFTDPEVVARALHFVGKLDKLPLPVQSAPGFLVNRVLVPYVMESLLLINEGIAPEVIDKAAEDYGMPMGPIELADTIGLDICVAAGENLGAQIPNQVKQWIKEGRLGKKTGRGFYTFKRGKPEKKKLNASDHIPEELTQRLIYRMLNEAVACLHENIVQDTALLDAGMIFGAGFPPFIGGPMQYIQQQGVTDLVKNLNKYAQRYGERFTPHVGWQTIEGNNLG